MLLLNDICGNLLPLPTQASLWAWRCLCKHHASYDILPVVSFPLNSLETTTSILNTNPLLKCGISGVLNFYKWVKLKTIEKLEEEFHLPRLAIFTTIRTLHFLTKYPIVKLSPHPKAWGFYTLEEKKSKGISLFYDILQNKPIFCKSRPMH